MQIPGFENNISVSQFFIPTSEIQHFAVPTLAVKFLWEFVRDGRTPARAMTDEVMKAMLPALEGSGVIIELGAGGDYYKSFVREGQQYMTSNLVTGSDIVLDMTNLDLPSESVDALVSVFALEHLFDFKSVFDEQYRVLRPGGRLLLVVPFMYYYHAAPDDYFRFSESSLDQLLTPYNILRRQPLGGRWLLFAELLHEKVVMGSTRNCLARFALRILALPFLAFSLKQHNPKYAVGFAYLCEKKG